MLKTLSENLNLLMSKHRLNSSELARLTNVPAATIKRIRNNEQANPTLATLLPVANYFAVSLNQLVGNEPLDLSRKASGKAFKIPKLSWQECVNYLTLDYKKLPDWIFTEKKVSDKAFALIIENDELNSFPKNNILIVETEIQPQTNDYVIVAHAQHQFASIRKYIVEIDQVYLKPLVTGAAISALTSEFKILGVVVQSRFEFR